MIQQWMQVAVVGAALVGCARPPLAARGPLTVVAGYAFPAIGGGASAFVSIANAGPPADTLVEVESPWAGSVMLHQTETRGTMARMVHLDVLPLPPGQTAVMASGKMHLMLSDVTHEFAPGDSCPLVLVFARAGRLPVTLPVVQFGSEPK